MCGVTRPAGPVTINTTCGIVSHLMHEMVQTMTEAGLVQTMIEVDSVQ